MKKTLILIFGILLISNLALAGAKEELSGKLSGFFSNLIPGDGDTEVSIDVRENYSPDYSILMVRELNKDDNGNMFTQLSLFNTEKDTEDRIVANLGLGKRFLSDDKFSFTGLNAFFDYDDEGNARTSIGLEARNAVMDFTFNQYFGIDNADGETVLDGYDLRVGSQVPYIHWASAYINSYAWNGEKRTDIEGMAIGSEMLLSPNINFEIAYDDKDKESLQDEWYAKIIYVHPPRTGPTAADGINSEMWRSQKDMSGELLTKVKRNNKIMVEFSGSASIVRAD